jgi:tetratricopeptide (TPR) repeat protein
MAESAVALAETLERLETRQLVRAVSEAEPTFTFKHNLVQQVAYESLLVGDRRGLHRAVAETLEALHGDRKHELAETLAAHFAGAGDAPRALEYTAMAADQAMRRFATAEAADLFARAIDLAGPAGTDDARLLLLYLARGRSLELGGRHSAALALYEELESLGRARSLPRFELAALIGMTSLQAVPTPLFDPTRAIASARRAVALAESIGDPAGQAKAYWLQMLAQTRVSAQDAVAAGQASLDLARRHGLREQEAFTLNDIQSNYQVLGQPDFALQALESARPIWRDLDNLPMLADNLASTSMLQAVMTEYAQAVELARESLAVSDRTGNLWGQSYGRVGLCLTHFGRGELGPGIREMNRCVELAEQAGFIYPQVAVRGLLALAYSRAGDLSTAAAQAARIQDVEAGSPVKEQLTGLAVRAWIAVQQGDLHRAEALLSGVNAESENLAMQLGDSPVPLSLTLCAYHMARQDFAQALSLVDRFSQMFDRFGWRIIRLPLLLVRGRALAGLDRSAEAWDTLESLRQAVEAQGECPALWEVEAELSRHAPPDADPQAAPRLLRSAAGRIRHIAAGLAELGLDRSFLEQPDVRSVLERAEQTRS